MLLPPFHSRCQNQNGGPEENNASPFYGGPEENRTPDLFNAIEALYQLSYGPAYPFKFSKLNLTFQAVLFDIKYDCKLTSSTFVFKFFY